MRVLPVPPFGPSDADEGCPWVRRARASSPRERLLQRERQRLRGLWECDEVVGAHAERPFQEAVRAPVVKGDDDAVGMATPRLADQLERAVRRIGGPDDQEVGLCLVELGENALDSLRERDGA